MRMEKYKKTDFSENFKIKGDKNLDAKLNMVNQKNKWFKFTCLL